MDTLDNANNELDYLAGHMIARSLLNDGIIDQKVFDRINSAMARTLNIRVLDYKKDEN